MAGPTNAGRKQKPKAHTVIYRTVGNGKMFMVEEVVNNAGEALERVQSREGMFQSFLVFEAPVKMFEDRLVSDSHE